MKALVLIAFLSITAVGFGDAQALSGGSAIHWRQFASTLETAKKVVIYFGTPRRWGKDAKPSEQTVIIDDFEFYRSSLDVPPEYQLKLRVLISDPGSFSEYRGMKLCGGFHPDVCIEWQFEQDDQHWHKRAFACLDVMNGVWSTRCLLSIPT